MITNDDIWDLFTEKTTMRELEVRCLLASARHTFREALKPIPTRRLLRLRQWDAGFEGFSWWHHDVPYNLYQLLGAAEEFYAALKEVLATREHVWRGPQGKAHRRQMAQMHHGSKKLKKRYVNH